MVNEGGDVIFECAYTNATSITWLRGGVAIAMENSSESSLMIESVTRDLLNTNYSCVAATPTNTTESVNFQLLVNCESPLPLPGPVIEGSPFAMSL